LSALTSTNPPDVNAVPNISLTLAFAAAQATTPSSTALVPIRPEAVTDQPTQRSQQEMRWSSTSWTAAIRYQSTPLNMDKLALELVNHPNSSFVSNLISALRYGTRICYLGPHKTRVSRNLISAFQHPDVVSENINKEVPFPPCLGTRTAPIPLGRSVLFSFAS